MAWHKRVGKARHFIGRYWALLLATLLTFAAMVLGTIAGLEQLWERWTDYPYNHAFVIFIMSAWLAIDAIRNARIERPHPSAVGGVALCLALAVYLVFETSESTLGMQVMLPLLLLAIAATIAGVGAAVRLAIPILFLYFAIPIWDLFIPPLQQTTVAVVSTVLRWTGFTAFIDGSLIHIPAGTFEVAESCAGLRYFIVSLTLATFYGILYLRTWFKSVALIAVAIAAASICNWIRVYSLVVIGDLSEMQHYLIAVSHARFGWFIYGFSLVPVFGFAVFLERRQIALEATRLPAETRLASPVRYLVTATLASVLLAAPYFLRSYWT